MNALKPSRRMLKRAQVILASVVTLCVITATGCASETPQREASAETPAPAGEAWVVSLGDSIISGEAGRWAGNQTGSTSNVDALGSAAYLDAGAAETIDRCHRSKSAAIHIGVAQSMNLACSGAKTATYFDANGNFKPGIDFYNEGGRVGQALMLEQFARDHSVKLVALSIGANDFSYEAIVTQCVTDYLKPMVMGAFCSTNPAITSLVSGPAREKVRADTQQAIQNITTAMRNAGYSDDQWALGIQLYPQLIAPASEIRYAEALYDRQLIGGCGFRDADITWIRDTWFAEMNRTFAQAAQDAQSANPSLRVVTLDASPALGQHTLCNTSVHRVQSDAGAKDWRDANAVDLSEWAMEINMVNPRDTFKQESFHPNYWGQLALRSCWRQAWNNGAIRGGTCSPAGSGLNEYGEPNMRLS